MLLQIDYVVRFLFGLSDIPRSAWKGKKMCQMAKFHKTNYLGNFLRKMLVIQVFHVYMSDKPCADEL